MLARPCRRFARLVAVAALVGASAPARAHATPEFPAVVVKVLKLPRITVDPPSGCTLCHTTDAGGTSVKAFGQLLEQYGVRPFDDASLEQALGQLAEERPQLVADIEAGRDPSVDTTGTHSPAYGCSVLATHQPRSALVVGFLTAAAAVLLLGRRRARPRS